MFNSFFRDPDNVTERRKRQIDTLKIFNDHVTEVVKDVEYIVEFESGSRAMVLNVSLGPKFPLEKPILKINPPLNHQWVAQNGEIVSAPGLLNFTVYSDLGRVVQAIVREFELRPPSLLENSVQQPQQVENAPVSSCAPLSPNNFIYSGANISVSQSYSEYNYPSTSVTVPFMHPVLTNYPELNSLSIAELQELNDDPEKLNFFIESLPTKQALDKSVDEWIDINEKLAKSNLECVPELQRLQKEIQEKLDVLHQTKAEYDKFNSEYQILCEKYNPHNIRESLRQSVTQIDEESERVAEMFLAGDIDLDTFLTSYINNRMISHTRKTKDEKLSQQLEKLEQAGF